MPVTLNPLSLDPVEGDTRNKRERETRNDYSKK